MSLSELILKEAAEVLFQNYRSFPLVLTRGEGCRVWDAEGKAYLDFVAGIAVVNLGHCHPAVVRALREQSEQLMHVSNLYVNAESVKLARWFTDHCFADRVFFCNSGTEAVEGAIKLVRRYSWAFQTRSSLLGRGPGGSHPGLTLRHYAHALRSRDDDLSFAEFGRGPRRH